MPAKVRAVVFKEMSRQIGIFCFALRFLIQAGTPLPNTNGDITNNTGRFHIARHGSTINAAFSDGRAENVPLANVVKLRWK